MTGWSVIDRLGTKHCVPKDDLRPHDLSMGCWCNPTNGDEDIVVHNSMDRREFIERGEVSVQ